MGFGNSYKVLSPLSWEPASGKQSGSPGIRGSSGGGGGDGSKRLVDFVKRWLLCGWNRDGSVDSPGKIDREISPGAGADGYVRPPRWKLFLRRVRARTRRVQRACCEGMCFHPQQQPLNYCSTDSYERNFDRGREFWSDDFGGVTAAPAARATFPAPASLHSTNSSAPILWEEMPLETSSLPGPIWQRRMGGDHLAPIAVAAA